MFEELTLILCLATPNISTSAVNAVIKFELLNSFPLVFFIVLIKLQKIKTKLRKKVSKMSKVNRSGTREVIFKVFQRCLAECEAGRILWDLDDVYGRTASMTGKSESTVRRIVNEGFKNDGKFETPGKHRKGRPKKEMDNFNICALRQKIQYFYTVQKEGSVMIDAGRYQDALDKFHSCTRLQPQAPEPLKQVAKCLFRQGRFQLSLEAYLEADKLTKYPDAEIYHALANCAWSLGDIEHGVEWARAAVQAGGGEKADTLLARLLQAYGDVDGALAAYDHALSLHACGADTLAAAGALRLRAGDPRQAFQLLGAALALQPTQHAAALALAAMMLQHKDVDAGLARLKAALSAHPSCVAAHTNLGLALLAKKKFIASLTCLQRAVWTAPLSARANHDLGLVLLICKRPASAFCRLATAAALRPMQPYTVLMIGIALERLKDSRSDAAYFRAVALSPDDPLIRLNLAARHARAGRFDKAIEEARLTAELLKGDKPDHQLTSSLATLMELLRDAAGRIKDLSAAVPETDVSIYQNDEINSTGDNLDPDEV